MITVMATRQRWCRACADRPTLNDSCASCRRLLNHRKILFGQVACRRIMALTMPLDIFMSSLCLVFRRHSFLWVKILFLTLGGITSLEDVFEVVSYCVTTTSCGFRKRFRVYTELQFVVKQVSVQISNRIRFIILRGNIF